MLRSIALAGLILEFAMLTGCDQPAPTGLSSNAAPSGATLAPASQPPGQAMPGTPPAAPMTETTPMPTTPAPMTETPMPVTSDATGATLITLEAAYAGMERAVARLGDLFDSIQDDPSAMAAAPQIAQAGGELAAGMKQIKTVIAALSLSGQKEQVAKFMEQKALQSRTPQDNLIDKLERVVNSPQHPLVRNEINGLLDGMLEAGTSGSRRGLERVIQQKKLRR